MSLELKSFDSLGRFDNDWLNANYHFSFANYYDPERIRVGPLRVWNDDTIRAGTGFDPHPHRDMEIITYVRSGAITHRDSLGNEGKTRAGDVQVMSAGRGIVHAEYNLEEEDTTLFQIWILPRSKGGDPRWETRQFPRDAGSGQLQALASGREGVLGAIPIDQDATLFAGTLQAGSRLEQRFEPGRKGYLVAARGSVIVNGIPMGPRDGLVIRDEALLTIDVSEEAELILVDLP